MKKGQVFRVRITQMLVKIYNRQVVSGSKSWYKGMLNAIQKYCLNQSCS